MEEMRVISNVSFASTKLDAHLQSEFMKEFTREKNHLNVALALMLALSRETWSSTSDCTLENDPLSVQYVRRLSHTNQG